MRWQEREFPELEALAGSETEAASAVESFKSMGHRQTHIDSNAAVAMTAMSVLQAVLARTEDRKMLRNDDEGALFDLQSEKGRKTHEQTSHPR